MRGTKRADLDEKSLKALGAFDDVKVISRIKQSQGNVGGEGEVLTATQG